MNEFRVERRWLLWTTLIWLATVVVFIWLRWGMIHWFSLPDTDDNMRMSQVRALMAGQGWYDLRQHKLNPPFGFNMHWSRLVDLPIAAIELVTRPIVGAKTAEYVAAAAAPILPLWVAMTAMGLTVRRLVAPSAFVVAAALMLCCTPALFMFMPMRIDHHGWQLAFLVLGIAGLADPDPRRGGVTMGLSSAASLVIGLELIPFLVIIGAASVLRWVWQPEDGERLARYGVALAIGTALGYLGFASYDNAAMLFGRPRCDVLSPVYLTAMVGAGWVAWLLPQLPLRDWRWRLGAAAVGGFALAGGFALLAPQCLGRPEQVSPELYASWLSHINEAKPLLTKDWSFIASLVLLPLAGLAGAVHASVRAWRTDRFAVWAPIALISLVSLVLLLWQIRLGPASQLVAVPGATALAWWLVPRLLDSGSVLVRTLGTVAAVLVVSGLAAPLVERLTPPTKPNARSQAIDRANGRCPTLPALHPIALLPATTIFTFVDLGPRLITVTHHRAVAGPYHRNGTAILDVHHAFGGTPDTAREIIKRHRATLLMTCPNMSESTIYRARTPNGFYAQLASGKHFAWLDPVPLPDGSPLLLWRVK